MTDRLHVDTSPPSESGETQDSMFIVDIPLTALRNQSTAPEQTGKGEASISHPRTVQAQSPEGWVANVCRWFFADTEPGSLSINRRLELTSGSQGPGIIDIVLSIDTQSIEWYIPVVDIVPGSYELVLGISSQHLDLNAVDSIAFDYIYGPEQVSNRPSEVIPNTALHDLFVTSTAGDNDYSTTTGLGEDSHKDGLIGAGTILRWKLYEHILVESGAGGTIKVTMSIGVWKGVSINPGKIRLHFLELHQDSSKVYKNDPSYRIHRPFTWCADINFETNSPLRGVFKEIISCHFSGDGAYVALLTRSPIGLHLDLHKIQQNHPISPGVASWTLSPYPTAVLDISVSWSASQIVVLDHTGQNFSASYVRQHQQGRIQNIATTTSGLLEEQYVAGELHRDLKRYRGRGTFHVSGNLDRIPKDRILKDERFIAFDGITVVNYSVYGKWEEVGRITIGGPGDSIDLYPYWKEHLRRDYLLLLNKDKGYVSIWNLGKKCPVAAMDIPATISGNPYIAACLSACGGLFVMATIRHVDVYLTDTWTRLGSWILPTADQNNISDVYFMNGSEYITIDTSSYLGAASHSHGYVVDIHTMTLVNRVHSRNLRPYKLTHLDPAGHSASMLLYQSQTMLGAIRYTHRLVRPFSKAAAFCTDECTPGLFFQLPSPPVFQAEVVEGTAGPQDRPKSMRFVYITAKSAIDTTVDVISIPLPNGSELLGLSWTLAGDQYILVMTITALMIVWRIPATLQGDYELILARVSTFDSNWSVCRHQQLRQLDRGTNIVTVRNLLDPCIRDSGAFLDGVVQLSRIFKDTDNKCKRGIICYVERHINHSLGADDISAAVLARLCASWTPTSHEHLLVFTRALFGSPSFRWIPTAGMSRQTNPISILFSHLDSSVVVIDIAEIMISYCVCQAKAESDLRFYVPVFLSLRAAVKSKYIPSSLLLRTMRSFANFPPRDYHFVMDHHAFALPIFKYRERDKMLHERKHPTLYLTSRPVSKKSNERLTPHLYVASFDMLWVIEEVPFPKQRFLAIALRLLLLVTLTSRERYVCHPFSLKDLDNPALAALVRFKWTQFGYVYWIYRFIFYCYIAWFFVALILSTLINDRDDEPVSRIYNANICLSWIFALGSARDLVLLTCLKMKPRDFLYKVVEVLVAFVPSIAVLAVALSLNVDLFYFVTSLSILVLLLQLLFEFRVMKTIGIFLSVLWRALHSVKILLIVFAYIICAYGVVFFYLQYLACEGDKCPKIPDNNSAAFVTITSTYFMTGGMNGLVEEKVKAGDWILHVVMVTFLFVVTIMLNILFGMVNHAFGNHDRTSELEWMEDRMLFVTRAENMFRSIPFLRKSDSWFPEKIYYTATPQEVRDFRLESQRLIMTATATALPLEDDIQEEAIDTDEPTENAVTVDHQGLEKQQYWVDQLKEDMKADFKEELREQLEVQKGQLDEQIERLQTQLGEILAVLRAGSKGI